MSKRLSAEQKTFNKAARHLLRQMKRSEENGSCLYRGPNGLRCAAGVLVSNKEYSPGLEGTSVHGFSMSKILSKKGYDLEIAQKLQNIHDHNEPNEWKGLLEELAMLENLKMVKV